MLLSLTFISTKPEGASADITVIPSAVCTCPYVASDSNFTYRLTLLKYLHIAYSRIC